MTWSDVIDGAAASAVQQLRRRWDFILEHSMRSSAQRGALFAITIGTGLAFASGPATLAAEPADHLKLVYEATFANGSLEPSVDKLGIGPLKIGDSRIAGSNPIATPQNGQMVFGITRPANLTGGAVASGAFATPVNFDVGSKFGLRATYIAPSGPSQGAVQWAVGLNAKTGAEDDLAADTRLAATLQSRGGVARLGVNGLTTPPNLPFLPQNIFDAIYDPTDPQPFTLELVVDRITGSGTASLKVGDFILSHEFQTSAFQENSGPAITAVGPSIAIVNAPGQSATVRVRDFRIFTPKASEPNPAAAGCPPDWAEFNCRAAPRD